MHSRSHDHRFLLRSTQHKIGTHEIYLFVSQNSQYNNIHVITRIDSLVVTLFKCKIVRISLMMKMMINDIYLHMQQIFIDWYGCLKSIDSLGDEKLSNSFNWIWIFSQLCLCNVHILRFLWFLSSSSNLFYEPNEILMKSSIIAIPNDKWSSERVISMSERGKRERAGECGKVCGSECD